MKRNIALVYYKSPVEYNPDAEIALSQERKAMERVCAERNWIPEWYERGGPGWEALTAQLDRSDVAAVVAYSTVRLTRRLQVLVSFFSECQQHGVDVVTVADGIDTSNSGWEPVNQVLTMILAPDKLSGRHTRRRSPSK